jgi:predicted RND superfamily exporter protein
MPIIVMAVLFGLAMDYHVFLVSRIHETVSHGTEARAAVEEGGRHAGRVVAAAALIMIGVFASFVVSGNATVRPIAFALALGVLVDAFVVRLTSPPAEAGGFNPRGLSFLLHRPQPTRTNGKGRSTAHRSYTAAQVHPPKANLKTEGYGGHPMNVYVHRRPAGRVAA